MSRAQGTLSQRSGVQVWTFQWSSRAHHALLHSPLSVSLHSVSNVTGKTGCRARATALEKAIDTLLTPVTNALEELLSGKAAEMGKGQSCYWHTASLKEFLFLLPTAAKMHNGVGLTSLSHAFGSMVTVVHALSQAALDAEVGNTLHLRTLVMCRKVPTSSIAISALYLLTTSKGPHVVSNFKTCATQIQTAVVVTQKNMLLAAACAA